jgi:hypothetical protein
MGERRNLFYGDFSLPASLCQADKNWMSLAYLILTRMVDVIIMNKQAKILQTLVTS